MAQLTTAWEGVWVAEDWHNFGPDYDLTCMQWWKNFERAWPELRASYSAQDGAPSTRSVVRDPIYTDRFYRMWKYYLMASAGSFRARRLQLWQIVLSKGDIPSYTPVR